MLGLGGLCVLEDEGLQKMGHLRCNLVIVGRERECEGGAGGGIPENGRSGGVARHTSYKGASY